MTITLYSFPKRISIHALRVEGDDIVLGMRKEIMIFLSTPSVWRATPGRRANNIGEYISIHALRVEGDIFWRKSFARPSDFYPRPPCGGRQNAEEFMRFNSIFLSTPSVWRATVMCEKPDIAISDFYPRPPCGGRLSSAESLNCSIAFLSTPSVWRATAKVHKILFHFAAQTRKFVVLILQSILSLVLSKPFHVLLHHFSAIF